jgi:hypothetical protein
MKKTTRSVGSQFAQIPTINKVIIFVILIAAFAVGIASPSLFKGQSTTTTKKSEPTITGSLGLTTDKRTVVQGEKVIATLSIDSGGNGVDAADFVLTYDQKVFSADGIKEGEFFKMYPLKKISDGVVKVSGVALLANNQLIIPKGRGVVATVTFTALSPANDSKISVDKNKTIAAASGKNIIDFRKVSDATVTVR